MFTEVLDAMIMYGLIGACLGGLYWKLTAASRANRGQPQDRPGKPQ